MIKLSIQVERREVEIGEKLYTVREMTGDRYSEYLTRSKDRMEGGEMVNFAGLHSELLAFTLFDEELDQPVELELINQFPASTVLQLFDLAQEINGQRGSDDALPKS